MTKEEFEQVMKAGCNSLTPEQKERLRQLTIRLATELGYPRVVELLEKR